jgi:hypothetical protein
MSSSISGKDIIDIIPDDIERHSPLAQGAATVSNWLREAAYIGDAIPLPFVGDVAAAGLSALAGGADVVAHYLDGGSHKGAAEIAFSSAAEAGVMAIPGDFIGLDQITAGARYLGLEIADLPAMARYGTSSLFNKLTGNETSAVYQPKTDPNVIDAEATVVDQPSAGAPALPAPTS